MFVEVDNKKIHYKEQGRGEVLLFVHGWGGTIQSLQKLADILSSKYKTITLDLPGFGTSDLPEPNWGVAKYADIIVKCITKLNLGSVLYIGHSFGGSLGIYIASHNPGIIKKLILLNSSYKRTNKQSTITKNIKQNIVKKLPFHSKWEPVLRNIIYRIFFRKSDMLKYPHLESNFKKIMTEDLTPFTKHITVPTLIIWGEKDTYTPVNMANELHHNIQNSTLKIIPHARHNVPILYPELTAQEIQQFIQ